MSILHNVYQGFSSAVNLVVEKNRKNNLINRIKYVIREEETKANQAYIALGKYYFNHLRKEENQIPIIKDNHIHPFGDTEK